MPAFLCLLRLYMGHMTRVSHHIKRHYIKVLLCSAFVALSAVAGVGYAAYQKINSQLAETNERNLRYQEQLQDSLVAAQEQAAQASDSAAETQASLEVEKKKNEELASDFASTKESSELEILELKDQLDNVSASSDSSELVADWEDQIGYLACSDGSSNWNGSATSFKLDDGAVLVVSNYHMLEDAYYCLIAFPGDSIAYYYVSSSDFRWNDDPYDWAYFEISSPSSSLYAASSYTECTMEPDLGDTLIILGYPSVGSTSSVTVTRGIVSGFDDEFIVTDAKIDHGNSGGAAIDVERNCFVGIPTAAVAGTIESFGRILDINKFL